MPLAGADPVGYADAVNAELASHPYLTVMPAGDDAISALSAAPAELLDKVTVLEAARAVGLEMPPTQVFASGTAVLAQSASLTYPLVVKPNTKRYAAARVVQESDLAAALRDDGPVLVQPYMKGEMHGVLGLMWEARLVASVHLRYVRLWPYPCGTVAFAETIPPSEELNTRLEALLRAHHGVFHADLAGPYLLDLNPRVHATLPLATAAGADLVGMYCDLMSGQMVRPTHGRSGVRFRWIEGDLRTIFGAVRQGRMSALAAAQALVPRPGEVYGYESFADAGPAIARLRYAGRHLRGDPEGAGRTAIARGKTS
ncbi:MAG: hypothetical protein M3T56_02695 [Chloroflexota bacterium]|nr:hypothetical protein [Chloroflexota bacterium]